MFTSTQFANLAVAQSDADQWHPRAVQLFESHCLDCHGAEEPEAGLNFEHFFRSLSAVRSSKETWEKVLRRVSTNSMPPPEMEPLAEADRIWLAEWIDTTLHHIDCSKTQHPGYVTIRRLTRLEYRNTIRDLLLVDYEPAAAFPGDDSGYGFDNIGDVLSLPPVLMEKYLHAAESISQQVLVADEDVGPMDVSLLLAEFEHAGGIDLREGRLRFFSNGKAESLYESPRTESATLKITAIGQQAGDEPCKMSVWIDKKRLGQYSITRQGMAQTTEIDVRLVKGVRRIGISFDNDYYQPDAADESQRDRNLIVQAVSIVRQPAKEELQTDAYRNFFFVKSNNPAEEESTAKQLIHVWASRCYRRPSGNHEVRRLFEVYRDARRDGASFEKAMQYALQAILVSPKFLYKVERPAPRDGRARMLTNYELATNLSYFLWSSAPDKTLLSAASQRDFQDPGVLHAQVKRMLTSDKADQLIDNFAVQWLQLRILSGLHPDPELFDADQQMLHDMRRETTLFVREILRGDLSLLNLLSGDFTFVNQRLADHYELKLDLENPPGDEQFVRVSLSGTRRGGLLTQGSILTLTSNPTRTSPVKRGKWILENLLAQPPSPPLPDVMPLEQQELTGTLRERLEQHRKDTACAVCHDQMDPLGFALENFDAVGRWRELDGGAPIDAGGQLPSGEHFSGAAELVQVLLDTKKDQFVRCLTEKMLTYAPGSWLKI